MRESAAVAPHFLGDAWAEAVRIAVDAGPDAAVRRHKIDTYWNWVEYVRANYGRSWALGVQDRPGRAEPRFLVLDWRRGQCTDAAITSLAAAQRADYILCATYQHWRALAAGGDPARAIMYRNFLLHKGNVLEFFRSLYFFTESLGCIARTPAAFD
ncbi:hypothetical protein ACIA8C_12730 [Nocardia sp. NPDC051321]|uniref:hypothetical protein n=1 Tax=Nocardia sp. NPDC051321 TaxID=3364323 RepID=UPI00378FCB25